MGDFDILTKFTRLEKNESGRAYYFELNDKKYVLHNYNVDKPFELRTEDMRNEIPDEEAGKILKKAGINKIVLAALMPLDIEDKKKTLDDVCKRLGIEKWVRMMNLLMVEE